MTRDPLSARTTEPSATAPTGGGVTPARDALNSLLGRRREPQPESRRVAIVLAVIITLGVAALDVAIYHAARSRMLRDRWEQLAASTDERRSEIRAALKQFEQAARYVAGRTVPGGGSSAVAGPAPPEGGPGLERDLDWAAEALRFRAIQIVGSDGSVRASSSRAAHMDATRGLELARRARARGKPAMAVENPPGDPSPVVWIAVPMTAGGEPGASVVAVADVPDLRRPMFLGLPARDARAGAYLVARSGNEIRVLSVPPSGSGLSIGDRVPVGESRARAAAIAAAGEESRVEIPDGHGGAAWAVTRSLPEIGVGLVGQADRSVMLAGTRDTLAGLLTLDLGIGLLAVAAIWIWRRRHLADLARRERELTARQADRVRAVFDHAFDAILTFDAEGRVLAVNRAVESLFRRPAAQIVGEPIHRCLRCGVPGRPVSIDPQALETVTCSEALGSDGRVIPVEYSLTCAGEGEDLVYTAVVRNISDRVNAENRVRSFAAGLEVTNRRLEEANAQLEQASRLKSEFLANTSHELRTPLNGMIGFLQLVLDGLCDSREEERDFLQQALQCSRHLLGLINDVLDIAKIEAGKLPLEIEAVDVRAVFGEVYTLTHVQAAQKGLTLKFEPPEHVTHPARGDFNKIKQVLINLVSNSLKFTSRGSITVRATEHGDLGHYMFEVIDTGIGVPADRRKLIFEKFIQGDGSSTRKYGGTGLGLAISRSLVELMGGIIDVQSDGPGKGTRLYFSLPVWRGSSDETAAGDQRVSDRIDGPAGGPLILVVEDDGVFRKYLSSLLHHHGYRTLEASHAEGGWMLARRLRPALVVLDYALSSAEGASLRTGWDLAERMTTDPRTRHIPLIFVTGFDLQIKERLKATVFSRRPEHLMKPVDGHVLIARIEEMVGASHGGVIRVLMADDDPSVSAYVRKVLPEDRYHIQVANDGDECLHILRTQPRGFDLLLLDLMMPDVSGYDVLRELSLSEAHGELPVLILTNFPEARTDEEKQLLEKGLVIDVIAKPSVHDNPVLLSHIIDWHLQVAAELGHGPAQADETTVEETRRQAA